MIKQLYKNNFRLIYLIRYFSIIFFIVLAIIYLLSITSKYSQYSEYIRLVSKQIILLEKMEDSLLKNNDKLQENMKLLNRNEIKISKNTNYEKIHTDNDTLEFNNLMKHIKKHLQSNIVSYKEIILNSKDKLVISYEKKLDFIEKESEEFKNFVINLTTSILLIIIFFLYLESKLIIQPILEKIKNDALRNKDFKRKLTKTFRTKTKRINDSLDIINHYVFTSKTDHHGVITYVSDAFCELTGYSKEELIGETHAIIRHPDTPKEVFKELWKTIIGKKVYEGEIKNIKKNGEEFWVSSYIQPELDENGDILGFIAYRKDITHEKTLENINKKLALMVKKKTKKLQKRNKQLKMLSETDALTSIYNRKKFIESLQLEIKKAKRFNETFSIIVIDIDHFKKVNDTYGHLTGDKVLIEVSKLISQNIRDIDLFARWGGEEFCILVNKLNAQESKQIAEKLRVKIEETTIKNLNITCSFGVTNFEENDNNESIFAKADEALYRAKEEGRNRVYIG